MLPSARQEIDGSTPLYDMGLTWCRVVSSFLLVFLHSQKKKTKGRSCAGPVKKFRREKLPNLEARTEQLDIERKVIICGDTFTGAHSR